MKLLDEIDAFVSDNIDLASMEASTSSIVDPLYGSFELYPWETVIIKEGRGEGRGDAGDLLT